MMVNVAGLTEENFHSLTPSALEAAIGAPLEEFDLIVLNPDASDQLWVGGQRLTYGETTAMSFDGTDAAALGAPINFERTIARNTFFHGDMEETPPEVGQTTIPIGGKDFQALTDVKYFGITEEIEVYVGDGNGGFVPFVNQTESGENIWMASADFSRLFATTPVLDAEEYPFRQFEYSAARYYMFVEDIPATWGAGAMAVIGGVSSTGALTSCAVLTMSLTGDGNAFDLIC